MTTMMKMKRTMNTESPTKTTLPIRINNIYAPDITQNLKPTRSTWPPKEFPTITLPPVKTSLPTHLNINIHTPNTTRNLNIHTSNITHNLNTTHSTWLLNEPPTITPSLN